MRSPGDILYNFHWIAEGEAARSAQAYAGFLGPFLKSHGIRTLINLRGPNPRWRWWYREKRVCERAGVEHLDAMLNSRRLPTKAMLLRIVDSFDAAKRPFLLKCSGGQDRSSFAAALYILHARGWSAFADAKAQFARWPYLHFPKKHQRWLKPFLEFAQTDASGTPLREWLARDYTSERYKDWLIAHGLGESFRGLYSNPGA